MLTLGWILIVVGFATGPLFNKQAHRSKWWFYGSLVVAGAGILLIAAGTGEAT